MDRTATTSPNWLTPGRAFFIVGVALVVCVASGVTFAIYPKWLQHHRDKTGWLPDAADVVEVNASVWDEEVNDWVSRPLPLDTVPEILKLLQREVPDTVLRKRAEGRMISYDHSISFSLELKASSAQQPVRITAMRSRIVRVGNHRLVLGRDDFAVLVKLVLNHYYAADERLVRSDAD